MHSLKLLLVEDAVVLQKLQSAMFQKFGHHPVVAASGEQALEILKKESFDVIMMDLVMPGMDGFECTRNIRQSGINTPIVALSGNDDEETLEICYEVGIDGFLKKPTNKAAFDAMMHHIFE
ncbi:response regulator [Hydrogenovibrio marinus]|uniref:Response regulatory domain-containing protein n=1 Tax=Hydrogenovibrio marinus TaxID=28885 RepID=A0A067A1Q3_HYDMR|nr:response regulator [Hydrogenovibrio marinus]KDN96270.1 hypothetical protein EI16_08305 [Hydrogenovibrio marinus]BBN60547.1 hypothetical protein HVMH_2141 [Hydrogenovibrio marinus]